MKFMTIADWTGIVETELFADIYRSYGLATVRYPVLEITAHVEPFENGNGYTLRALRAGKPRSSNVTVGIVGGDTQVQVIGRSADGALAGNGLQS